MAVKPAAVWQLRALQASDAAAFQALRLQALHAQPDAFAASAHEQAAMSLQAVAQGIAPGPRQWVLGAWDGAQLVGILGLQRAGAPKLAHKAQIWGVYVQPDYRGQGMAHALLGHALEHARRLPGLEVVQLGVASHNHAALALYQRHGFVRYASEPRALCVDGVYIDEDWMALHL